LLIFPIPLLYSPIHHFLLFNRRLELERLQSLYDSTVAATKERSRAVTLNLSVASHDKLIRDNLSRLHRGVQLLEINLSKEEEHGGYVQSILVNMIH